MPISEELQAKLIAPLPAADHKDRKLPGGQRWVFVPWHRMRDRLNEICDDWSVDFSDPQHFQQQLAIKCTITIQGVSRSAWGYGDPDKMRNEKSGQFLYGSPLELAQADAFKSAAEMFGIAAYVKDQERCVKALQSQGDSRAFKYARENGQVEAGARGRSSANSKPRPQTQNGQISKEQFEALKRQQQYVSVEGEF